LFAHHLCRNGVPASGIMRAVPGTMPSRRPVGKPAQRSARAL